MDNKTINFLIRHGYKVVSTNDVKNVLKESSIRKIHIEVTAAESSILFARVKESNVIIKYNRIDDESPEYLTIMQSDEFETHLFNVPINSIKNMIVKTNNSMIDIMFNVVTDSNSYRIFLDN